MLPTVAGSGEVSESSVLPFRVFELDAKTTPADNPKTTQIPQTQSISGRGELMACENSVHSAWGLKAV